MFDTGATEIQPTVLIRKKSRQVSIHLNNVGEVLRYEFGKKQVFMSSGDFASRFSLYDTGHGFKIGHRSEGVNSSKVLIYRGQVFLTLTRKQDDPDNILVTKVLTDRHGIGDFVKFTMPRKFHKAFLEDVITALEVADQCQK